MTSHQFELKSQAENASGFDHVLQPKAWRG